MPRSRTTESGSRRDAPVPLPGSGPSDGEIDLGYVSGVFGVRGEVRLYLHNPGSDLLREPRPVVLVGPAGERFGATMTARPGSGKRVLGKITGVDDPDAAARWMDWRLAIASADLPRLGEGEFWFWQVEGLPVFVGDREVGRVAHVHETEGGEVLELEVGGESAFVPVVERFVVAIDVAGGRVELAADALEEG